jgi:hypothetical protein
MRYNAALTALALSGLIATGVVVVLRTSGPQAASRSDLSPAAQEAHAERKQADGLYTGRPIEAENAYRRFVETHRTSPDPQVQDEVGGARLRLGYLAARRKDYGQARAVFLETIKEYKGTGAMGADFGGIGDQAAYQAAVSLVADGKKADARAAFEKFLVDYRLSPLVHAARRRLSLLGDGGKTDAYDRLLQSALNAQQKHIRFEMSVCGPKSLAYLLAKVGQGDVDYRDLAKECGTSDEGTSLEALHKALERRGIDAYGYSLNRQDIAKLSAPAIIVADDHYLVLDHVEDKAIFAYDPMFKSIQKIGLPKEDDPKFRLSVLSLKTLDLD